MRACVRALDRCAFRRDHKSSIVFFLCGSTLTRTVLAASRRTEPISHRLLAQPSPFAERGSRNRRAAVRYANVLTVAFFFISLSVYSIDDLVRKYLHGAQFWSK